MNIIGSVKQYEWGKLGASSKVAELAKLNSPTFIINPNESYSELWMGDHISGPSSIAANQQLLSDFVTSDKSVIGGMDKLPYLLKVLSIGKALSVQVHPNKVLTFHKKVPQIFNFKLKCIAARSGAFICDQTRFV